MTPGDQDDHGQGAQAFWSLVGIAVLFTPTYWLFKSGLILLGIIMGVITLAVLLVVRAYLRQAREEAEILDEIETDERRRALRVALRKSRVVREYGRYDGLRAEIKKHER